jgi:superfamily II DNA/RNA helicase
MSSCSSEDVEFYLGTEDHKLTRPSYEADVHKLVEDEALSQDLEFGEMLTCLSVSQKQFVSWTKRSICTRGVGRKGTGKSLAIALSALHHFYDKKETASARVHTLVLLATPLAVDSMQQLLSRLRVKCAAVSELNQMDKDVTEMAITQAHVVLGTFCRLATLTRGNFLDTAGLQLILVDDFDIVATQHHFDLLDLLGEELPAKSDTRPRLGIMASSYDGVELMAKQLCDGLECRRIALQEQTPFSQFHVQSTSGVDSLTSLLDILTKQLDQAHSAILVICPDPQSQARLAQLLQKQQPSKLNHRQIATIRAGGSRAEYNAALTRTRNIPFPVIITTFLDSFGLDIDVQCIIYYNVPFPCEF